jgi:hypothetical protein
MALLILLATPLVLLKISTDIFPEIIIPVISIVWTYTLESVLARQLNEG